MEKSNQVQQDNSNLSIYERVRCVPKEAKKEIEAGRLKGKHDINPMWRIKALTEVFGPAGFGWYTEIVRTWTEASESGEMAVFVDINLFVKKDGEWSRPIFGNCGNKLIANEKMYENGQQVYIPYLDDDAYKKAYTDAISVAAKALGVGSRSRSGCLLREGQGQVCFRRQTRFRAGGTGPIQAGALVKGQGLEGCGSLHGIPDRHCRGHLREDPQQVRHHRRRP